MKTKVTKKIALKYSAQAKAAAKKLSRINDIQKRVGRKLLRKEHSNHRPELTLAGKNSHTQVLGGVRIAGIGTAIKSEISGNVTLSAIVGKRIAHALEQAVPKVAAKGFDIVLVPSTGAELNDGGGNGQREEYVGKVEEDSTEESGWDPFEAGRKAIDELKNAEGGAVDRETAAKRLDLSVAQLYNRLNARRVVAWVDASGRYRFPKWQFGVNGLLRGVEECLHELDTSDEWAVMRFFLTPSESAGDISPLELLRQNRVQEALKVALAQAPA